MNKLKFIIILLLLFVFCGAINQASAQNNPNNYSSINVDDLSDQQIRSMMQQAQSSGLSDVEILQQAQNRGMSTANVQKLQARIRDIRSKQGGSGKSTDTIVMGGRKPVGRVDTLDTTAVRKDLFASFKPKIFGADFFKNKNNSFEPNLKLPTPANYVVGPDDQLIINVYGSSLVTWTLSVTPEGNINIPGIGIVNVGGQTIENATRLIKAKLSANNYAVGRGTNVQVSLGNIRSIRVNMVGQLVKPGSFTVSSLATAFNALYQAGGPSENGSLRLIEIIRNGKIIRHLDFYDFLTKGSQKDNIVLQDQDIVHVPPYKTRVEMAGEVKIPALFEVLPGEHLQDIIDYAGGFTDTAYTARIKVSQINNQQRRLTDVVEANYKTHIPLRGDKYTVESIINRFENRVIIKGAVFHPGEYELQPGLTLAQLIKNAAGIREDAFMDRGIIMRLQADNSKGVIAFNVNDVVKNAVNIPLQREDSVYIASKFDLRDKYTITINGSVRKAGMFAYADSMKVEDLIIKAGGFAEGASPKHIEVARRVNDADPQSKDSKVATVFNVDVDSQLKLENVNFALKPYDIVSVYTLPGYEKQKIVHVEGEVLYPGPFIIQTKNEKISDLVARAGGLTASADIAGGSLKRENAAILGIDKNKSDTLAIAKERTEQLKRLKNNYKDTTNAKEKEIQPRNNYVGIDLPGILKAPGSKIDLLLEDGDVLRIPKQQQVVRVNGEVLYPSAVVYDPGKSFKAYVLNAGGFSPDALKKGAYVVYPNGTVKGTRKFLFFNSHPDVKPGSEIYVPKKPLSTGNTAQEILAFTTGVASLGAIILGIISVTK